MSTDIEQMLRGYGAISSPDEMDDNDRLLVKEVEVLAKPRTIYALCWNYLDGDNRWASSSDLDSTGYFTDLAEARAYGDSLNRQGLDQAREQHAQSEEGERLAYGKKVRATFERQQEYDILTEAGHRPKWKRPADLKPFSYPTFDEEKWLKAQREHGYYGVEEFEPHVSPALPADTEKGEYHDGALYGIRHPGKREGCTYCATTIAQAERFSGPVV